VREHRAHRAILGSALGYLGPGRPVSCAPFVLRRLSDTLTWTKGITSRVGLWVYPPPEQVDVLGVDVSLAGSVPDGLELVHRPHGALSPTYWIEGAPTHLAVTGDHTVEVVAEGEGGIRRVSLTLTVLDNPNPLRHLFFGTLRGPAPVTARISAVRSVTLPALGSMGTLHAPSAAVTVALTAHEHPVRRDLPALGSMGTLHAPSAAVTVTLTAHEHPVRRDLPALGSMGTLHAPSTPQTVTLTAHEHP